MLKFIPVSVTLACLFSSFQNILCWSLSEQDAISTVPCTISKHLMLKFITRSLVPLQLVFAFQNILCWSLSVKATMEELAEKNFKTSYVEVYPDSSNCLLSTLYISKHLMLKFIRGRNPVGIFFHKFQNILCWSLSLTFGKCMIRCLHFKTSYVEVYPEPPVSINMNHINFKTSYVEVYPTGRSGCWIRFRISKHLMLKFIISGSRRRRGVVIISKHLMLKFIDDLTISRAQSSLFQNILCWSLSQSGSRLWSTLYTFQNILCWSLSCHIRHCGCLLRISKHLMLKFIPRTRRYPAHLPYFKTSYVEVYPKPMSYNHT